MAPDHWYARSPEIVHSAVMETLVWLRVPGDLVFAAGTLYLAWFAMRLLGLKRGSQATAVTAAQQAKA